MGRTDNNMRIAKNSLYLYIRMFFCLAVSLYTTRVLLNSLGVLDYGIYNVVGGVVSLMAFIQSAMANGFQRYYNIALGKDDQLGLVQLFSASIAVQIIISIFFLLLAETVGLWFLNTQLVIPNERLFAANIVYQSVVIAFLLTMVAAPYNAIIIAYEKMNLYAVVSVVNVLLKLLIAYVAAIGGDRLILYALLSIVVQLSLTLSYKYYARKLNDRLLSRPLFDKSLIKNLTSFSGWNLFGSLAHAAKGQGLNIVLNLFFDPTINAARGVAYQVSAGIAQFYQSFQTASRPQVIKYYAQGNNEDMLKLTYKVSKFSFMLLWLIDLPLLFTAQYFITLWLGDNFPPYAPLFTNIVLVTATIECLAHPISTLVHASGIMKTFQIITSSVILLIIPFAYIVLKLGFPPESALYCSLCLAPIVQLVRLILVKRIVPLSLSKYFNEVILPALIVAAVSYASLYVFVAIVDSSSFVVAIVGFFIAAVSIFFLGCNKSERTMLASFIKKHIK